MAAPGDPLFCEWIKEWELEDQTVDALAQLGFTSLKSCRLLGEGLIQKHFHKTLPLAQILLLQQAVEELRKPAQQAPPQEGSAEQASDHGPPAARPSVTATASLRGAWPTRISPR